MKLNKEYQTATNTIWVECYQVEKKIPKLTYRQGIAEFLKGKK